MAWTISELLDFGKECNSFQLRLESSPWEFGEGKTQREITDWDPARSTEFPEHVLMASFAIAQEWANQLGEQVRLFISADHGQAGCGRWAVKEFKPVSDGRTPRPPFSYPRLNPHGEMLGSSNYDSRTVGWRKGRLRDCYSSTGSLVKFIYDSPESPMSRPAVAEQPLGPFWPMNCAFCGRGVVGASHVALTYTRNGFVNYEPVCERHKAQAGGK